MHALPTELEATLAGLLREEVPALVRALQEPAPISLRLNAGKPSAVDGERIPWCASGRYLSERPAFTFDPLLHAGAYYVQEASSMLLEQAMLATGLLDRELLVLDLCAAPGGKSTHLRSLLTPGSLLVANEVEAARRSALAENLWKWGGGNVVITGNDPASLNALPEHFDLILIDAPCSGEGMYRKDPFARQQWSPALVARCSNTQRRIVDHAWEALAPGGVLIYSTCTWEPSENEEQLHALLQRGGEPIAIRIDPAWGVACTERDTMKGYRCYPHRTRGEGFFIGMMRKPGVLRPRTPAKDVARSETLAWLRDVNNHALIEQHGILHALDAHWELECSVLSTALRVIAPGTPFAERKGPEWKPHAACATSAWLDRTVFPELDLDEATAIRYLQGQALQASDVNGTALVTYQGHAIGWVQGAGARWNNRWPQPWRIRAQQPGAPRVSWSGASQDPAR